jgi:hypothetical protein
VKCSLDLKTKGSGNLFSAPESSQLSTGVVHSLKGGVGVGRGCPGPTIKPHLLSNWPRNGLLMATLSIPHPPGLGLVGGSGGNGGYWRTGAAVGWGEGRSLLPPNRIFTTMVLARVLHNNNNTSNKDDNDFWGVLVGGTGGGGGGGGQPRRAVHCESTLRSLQIMDCFPTKYNTAWMDYKVQLYSNLQYVVSLPRIVCIDQANIQNKHMQSLTHSFPSQVVFDLSDLSPVYKILLIQAILNFCTICLVYFESTV